MSLKMMSLIKIGLAVLTAVVVSECVRKTATPTPGPRRPRTGVLTKKLTGQRGKLRIKNKNNLDAVIVLTLPDEPEEAVAAFQELLTNKVIGKRGRVLELKLNNHSSGLILTLGEKSLQY